MSRSFAFTVRPIDGVSPDSDLEKAFRKLTIKYPGFIVAEKSGIERHLHGQLFFENPRTKSDFNRDFPVKLCKKHISDWTPQQERVLKLGTKVAYSNDFYTEYTNKPDSELLEDNFPANSTEFYPSQDEQDKVKARANAKDAKYFHLAEMWQNSENSCVPTYENVAKWLYIQMFVERTIRCIEDKRKITQTVNTLTEYLNADESRALGYMMPEKKKAEADKWKYIASTQKKLLENFLD